MTPAEALAGAFTKRFRWSDAIIAIFGLAIQLMGWDLLGWRFWVTLMLCFAFGMARRLEAQAEMKK